jgi:hypothetical protein
MNRRVIFALLALTFCSATTACGGGDDAKTQSTTLALSGVYRPVDQGPIASVTFSGKQDYLLMPVGCSGGGCAEIGTYTLDTASKVLVLENGATHETRSIALEVLETTPASGALVKSVAPLDLVDPGTQLARPQQPTTSGGGQQLATSGNDTTGAASQLLQLIKQLIMNGQQMKQDDQGGGMGGGGMGNPMPAPMPMADPMANPMPNPMPAPMNDPKVDCKQGIPTKDTPLSEVAAYFARCPGGP